jgi:hypothetical protein
LFAGSFDRAIQIGGRAEGNVRDHAPCGRLDHRVRFPVALRHPGAANEHFLRPGNEAARLFPDAELLQIILYDGIHHCLLSYGLAAIRPLVGRFRADRFAFLQRLFDDLAEAAAGRAAHKRPGPSI